MAFNKDELVPPAWLDNAYFETILRKSEDDSELLVIKSNIVPGSNAGDHFASVIFRVAISYKSRGKESEISVIIKTIPEQEGLKRDLLKDGIIFETEIFMYSTVLKEMHRLLRSVGDETVLAPRLLYSSDNPVFVMVFEDLSKTGYTMKYSQLNLDESKILYAKLARMHAASMILVDKIPEIKKLDKGVGNISGEFPAIWENYIHLLAKICKTWPGFESYGERLESSKKHIMEKINQAYSSSATALYNVLNHGDCHFKNMMFKIVDGATQDIMLLDFQISIWGTPAIDMIYSMYQTCSVETRDNHRDELTKFYHDEFVTMLNKFGYQKKVPSLIELNIEILKSGHMETFLSCTFLPFMILSSEDSMLDLKQDSDEGFEFDFRDEEKQEKMMNACFQHPKYVAVIKRYLPMLFNKGYLDFD